MIFLLRELRRVNRDLLRAEKRVEALEAELRGVRVHAQAREEALVDRVLTAAGAFAISKQVEVKTQSTQGKKMATPAELSAYEESVRIAFRAEASKLGRSPREADEVFERWRQGMPLDSLVDNAFVMPSD
jgi:hypothetical protein